MYVVCHFVLFLAIRLSVLLRHTDSDFPFGIFKLLSPLSLSITTKFSSARLYLQLFAGSFVSYLCYLRLFTYNGVKHILVAFLFVSPLCVPYVTRLSSCASRTYLTSCLLVLVFHTNPSLRVVLCVVLSRRLYGSLRWQHWFAVQHRMLSESRGM